MTTVKILPIIEFSKEYISIEENTKKMEVVFYANKKSNLKLGRTIRPTDLTKMKKKDLIELEQEIFKNYTKMFELENLIKNYINANK